MKAQSPLVRCGEPCSRCSTTGFECFARRLRRTRCSGSTCSPGRSTAAWSDGRRSRSDPPNRRLTGRVARGDPWHRHRLRKGVDRRVRIHLSHRNRLRARPLLDSRYRTREGESGDPRPNPIHRVRAVRKNYCSPYLTLLRLKRRSLRPVARSVVETGFPGGTCVAGSGRAEPRHLGGSP
jgi:hypothetical protein